MTETRRGIDPAAFRTKRNLALARVSEAARPLLSAAASVVSRGPRTDPRQWRNGLIVSHTHIGDVLYRTCSLPALSAALPDCRWSYLVSPLSAQVLESNHHVAEVLPFVAGENSWNLIGDGFSQLRRRQFDVVLCTNTLRHYPDLLLAAALGIPNRVGFTGKGMSGLINHEVALAYPKPYPAYFRDLVEAIGAKKSRTPLKPRIYLREHHRHEAHAARARAGFSDDRAVLACTVSTRQAGGAVSQKLFAEILEAATKAADFDVALCGSREERDQLAAFAQTLPFDVKVFAGDLSVMGFAAFLSSCFALLAPDTGPRHLGNAVGIPVFFTRNLSQNAVETGRYCDTETDLIPPGHELVSAGDLQAVEGSVDVSSAAGRIVSTLSA